MLKATKSLALDLLKAQSGLSGKKWDSAMKGLSKHGLVKVTVEGDNKTVELA
jgi:lysyl-tRNA synthetase class 2